MSWDILALASYARAVLRLWLQPDAFEVLPNQVARCHMPTLHAGTHHHNALPPQQGNIVGFRQHVGLEFPQEPVTLLRIGGILLTLEQLIERAVRILAAVGGEVDRQITR